MAVALWLRGDLRLADHAGFSRLSECSDESVAFFNLDPRLSRALTPHKRGYLMAALADLDDQLDGRLTLLHCDPIKELPTVLSRHGITSAITHTSVSPRQRRMLQSSSLEMKDKGIDLIHLDSPYSVAPGTLRAPSGALGHRGYRVYSPFYRAWQPLALKAAPVKRPSSNTLSLLERAFEPTETATSGGEGMALSDLKHFLAHNSDDYPLGRDFPSLSATSSLSTHLHFGTIHPRTIIAELEPQHEKFLSELAWREFYADYLYHDPSAVTREIDPRFRNMQWNQSRDRPDLLLAWKQGKTGYPLVDAGMRELATTHLMHNRVRMVTASFLIKDLHFDWRIGARYFEEQLIDGDIASNRLNWQWVAGTGTDAAPYFRIFNPTLQSKKFDPNGDYIKRWLPELRDLSREALHAPASFIDPLAVGYVTPIVDHTAERKEALRLYSHAKAAAQAVR